ncbi:hypothetical protein PV379_21625 [Streptomyces caniscabiei]|uniref:hypothetical protein n=1 Tax=Streptomyces caniscabiei TaxID=2746961 RepID=UPI0029A8FA86|nr:hypothetical protein [Streptomyces caniscabiei]MDX2601865.1 hypothetical protein [Streptomyces caniscabiei]MDX2737300.1 hypothetical protein [Streptomyces caniscabiei]MDX2779896.1 hypothetical protein [Streptomyces caniscabiei]
MSWKWEYAFGAEEAARTAPSRFLAGVEKKAEELVRAAEAFHVHGRAHDGIDPKGGDIIVPGGMFTYQVVVRSERVYVVQITYLGF